jgi:hypothetical protein
MARPLKKGRKGRCRMRWLNGNIKLLILVGFVANIVLGVGSGNAMIIMSEPSNLGPVINNAGDVQECDFSHDGLELYFSESRSGGYGSRDIWVTRRETLDSPWQEPVNLGPNVNSSGSEVEPSISGDGLELYFGCWDDYNIYVCTRSSKDAPWSSRIQVGPPVPSNEPWRPDISADGLSLYFASMREGGYGGDDIWVTTRATKHDPWGELVNLGPNVNMASEDTCPCISTDGLTLIFNRGYSSMWATTRRSTEDDWGPAVNLGISNSGNFNGAALSPDGSTMYFDGSTAWGGYGDGDLWQIKFIPIVDFNADEIVDIADLVILIEHWGQEDPLYDIGPLPLGDGMVDEADLEVLMSHWGQEAYDPTLIAYWKLDEAEGDIAYNTIGNHDAMLQGNPVWQTTAGKVDGALQLDGIDDYIGTDFVLNPADGPFSVFAWIQGGGPGQVIISQLTGAGNIWLGLDAQNGDLMTGLVPPSTGWVAKKPLVSEAIITDGQWHHVGFVWDGSYRALYADGIEVAKDTAAQNPLKSSDGGLYIGADKTLGAGTFFSGLIDDVRIYNRALTAEEIAALVQ